MLQEEIIVEILLQMVYLHGDYLLKEMRGITLVLVFLLSFLNLIKLMDNLKERYMFF